MLSFLRKREQGTKKNSIVADHPDKEFSALYDRIHKICAPEVDMSPKKKIRKYIIYQIVSELCKKRDTICSIEFGVFRGQTSRLIMDLADIHGCHVEHYIADSFQGLSQPDEVDGGKNAEMKFAMSPQKEQIQILMPDAKLIEGWIPECLPTDRAFQFNFAHVDVDLYEPVKGSLNWLKANLADNAIIIVDDYSERWPGCVNAVDEFLDENRNFIGHSTTLGNFIIYKLT